MSNCLMGDTLVSNCLMGDTLVSNCLMGDTDVSAKFIDLSLVKNVAHACHPLDNLTPR